MELFRIVGPSMRFCCSSILNFADHQFTEVNFFQNHFYLLRMHRSIYRYDLNIKPQKGYSWCNGPSHYYPTPVSFSTYLHRISILMINTLDLDYSLTWYFHIIELNVMLRWRQFCVDEGGGWRKADLIPPVWPSVLSWQRTRYHLALAVQSEETYI